MSQNWKFHNSFLTWSENETRCIFEDVWYCHSWKVQFQLSCIFLKFFSSGLSIAQVTFLVTFYRSANCVSWVLISGTYRTLNINLYLRPFSTAIYGKFDLYCLYLSNFYLISKLHSFGLQIIPLISAHLRFMVNIGGFR